MHIVIESVAFIGKGFTQKREKKPDDTEAVFGHLKFNDCVVTREIIDEIFMLPIGWTQASLYDDHGLPLVRMDLSLPIFECMLTGVIGGINPEDTLKIANAKLTGVGLILGKMGAKLSGEIIWEIAGDESADLIPLQGNECRVNWVLQHQEQPDMFKTAASQLVNSVPRGSSVTITSGDTSVMIDKTDGDTNIVDLNAPDPLIDEAVLLLIEHGTLTISKLQSLLKIGYNRSARLLEAIEARGLATPVKNDGKRDYVPPRLPEGQQSQVGDDASDSTTGDAA